MTNRLAIWCLQLPSTRDVWAVGLISLIALAFFWPLLFARQWIPRGGGDLVSFLWPQYTLAAQSIRSGLIPLWNPHLYSGVPLLADNQAGVLYPIHLLVFALLPTLTYQVMELLVVGHIGLAGVAMYAALRLWPGRQQIGRAPALLGATAYMLSDVFVTHVGNLNLIAVAAWMPLILGLFARGLRDQRIGLSVAAGITFGVAFLAGHAQMTAITLIGLAAIAVWQVIAAASWRDRARAIGLATLAGIIGLGLTAMQWLPALELTRHSLRAGLSYTEATAYSLPPTALASFVSPLLFGRGAVNFWGPWPRVEAGYIGLVPLLLIGFAFSRRRSNGIGFLVALGLLGVLIALGQYGSVYSIVHALPVLGGLRAPARFILLTDFAIAALAALGMSRLLNEPWSPRQKFLRIGAVIAIGPAVLWIAYRWVDHAGRESNLAAALIAFSMTAAIGLLWVGWGHRFGARGWAGGLIGLAAIELIAMGSTVEIDPNDPARGFDHPEIVQYLKSDPNVFRIESASGAWQPSAAPLHGLDDIGGIFNPLGLAAYETYRGGMGNRGSPLYNFLGVKYVLAPKGQPPGDASFVPVFDADPSIDVYLNTGALPRAQLVDQVEIVSSGEAAWAAIHAPDFDPASEVVIEGGKTLSNTSDSSSGQVSFVRAAGDQVVLEVKTSAPAYLVLSDVFYPGWAAFIDDRPAELLPANFAFRAVLAPAGSHRIRFEFAPASWRWGLAISASTAVGLLLLATVAALGARARRHRLRALRQPTSS